MNLEQNSTIKCLECGFEKQEKMSMDACVFFDECTNWHKVIRPKNGDCCVFCSYGSVSCPSIQNKVNIFDLKVYDIHHWLNPDKIIHFEYSTTKGIHAL